MLKVKNTSSAKGGSGMTTIARITIIRAGAPKPERVMLPKVAAKLTASLFL